MSKFYNRFAIFSTLVMVLFAVSVTAPACHKNKPCKAIIKVLDANNNPVAGATVRLDPSCTSCPPNPTISSISENTDASGTASFETELPKILDIIIIVGSNTYTTGKVVRFESGQTDEVTVNI